MIHSAVPQIALEIYALMAASPESVEMPSAMTSSMHVTTAKRSRRQSLYLIAC